MSTKVTALLAFGTAAALVLVGARVNRDTRHPLILALFVALAVTIAVWGALLWTTLPG